MQYEQIVEAKHEGLGSIQTSSRRIYACLRSLHQCESSSKNFLHATQLCFVVLLEILQTHTTSSRNSSTRLTELQKKLRQHPLKQDRLAKMSEEHPAGNYSLLVKKKRMLAACTDSKSLSAWHVLDSKHILISYNNQHLPFLRPQLLVSSCQWSLSRNLRTMHVSNKSWFTLTLFHLKSFQRLCYLERVKSLPLSRLSDSFPTQNEMLDA